MPNPITNHLSYVRNHQINENARNKINEGLQPLTRIEANTIHLSAPPMNYHFASQQALITNFEIANPLSKFSYSNEKIIKTCKAIANNSTFASVQVLRKNNEGTLYSVNIISKLNDNIEDFLGQFKPGELIVSIRPARPLSIDSIKQKCQPNFEKYHSGVNPQLKDTFAHLQVLRKNNGVDSVEKVTLRLNDKNKLGITFNQDLDGYGIVSYDSHGLKKSDAILALNTQSSLSISDIKRSCALIKANQNSNNVIVKGLRKNENGEYIEFQNPVRLNSEGKLGIKIYEGNSTAYVNESKNGFEKGDILLALDIDPSSIDQKDDSIFSTNGISDIEPSKDAAENSFRSTPTGSTSDTEPNYLNSSSVEQSPHSESDFSTETVINV
jgi:hypothetical protein